MTLRHPSFLVLSLLGLLGFVLCSATAACSGDGASIPSDGASRPDSSGGGTGTEGRPGAPATDTSKTDPSTTTAGGTACEAAGTAICARACACAGDGKCRVGFDIDAGPPATVSFTNEAQCLEFYVQGCFGGGSPSVDYARCKAGVEAAACLSASGGKAVLVPPSCRDAS